MEKDETRKEIDSIIGKMERRYAVPSGLLHAVVNRESRFDPNAVGQAGEIGLAQLMRGGAIAEWEQFKTPKAEYSSIENNLEVAAWYLGKRIPDMLRHYEKPVTIENRIIAYNAGISYVLTGTVPALTRGYIDEVKTYMSGIETGKGFALVLVAIALGLSLT